eukprot:TRINITY_DN38841_c0_g1_i1.p1 TRINITY_DN38841_c0_g1~~TRINITY_DN38841_c0_g1_i1.p1  ORF type:complete len:164 (+),score=15.27 TRINITY_DN38841_c0_g1_i1:403-894(+)
MNRGAQAPPGQGQVVCAGCRVLLNHPSNATRVRCALCSTITPVPPPGREMAQLVCRGCRTSLSYVRGASSVQCALCHEVSLAMDANQVAHVNCGGCGETLMYSYGAQSVKCAICQFVTPASAQSARRNNEVTVVVENPCSIDEAGNLVGNVAVGVTTEDTRAT